MENLNHVLCVAGILKIFSVSKALSDKELKKIKSAIKIKNINSIKYKNELTNRINDYVVKFIKNNQIPGIIQLGIENNTSDDTESNIDSKKNAQLILLNNIALAISKKIQKKNPTKDELCYFITSLIHYLQISDDDFDKFNNDNDME